MARRSQPAGPTRVGAQIRARLGCCVSDPGRVWVGARPRGEERPSASGRRGTRHHTQEWTPSWRRGGGRLAGPGRAGHGENPRSRGARARKRCGIAGDSLRDPARERKTPGFYREMRLADLAGAAAAGQAGEPGRCPDTGFFLGGGGGRASVKTWKRPRVAEKNEFVYKNRFGPRARASNPAGPDKPGVWEIYFGGK